MFAGSSSSVTCCAERGKIIVFEKFLNNFVERAVVVDLELFFVKILLFVNRIGVGAKLKFGSAIDLRNTELYHFMPERRIFAGSEYHSCVGNCETEDGNQPCKFLI